MLSNVPRRRWPLAAVLLALAALAAAWPAAKPAEAQSTLWSATLTV